MKRLVPFTTATGAALLLIAFSTSTFAQKARGRLPFIGTRTFCGQLPYVDETGREVKKVETKTFVTIRKNRLTTVKSNISGDPWRMGKLRYFTSSGKLDAGWCLCDGGNWYFKFTSATSIKIEGEDVIGEGELCTSDEAPPNRREAETHPLVVTKP